MSECSEENSTTSSETEPTTDITEIIDRSAEDIFEGENTFFEKLTDISGQKLNLIKSFYLDIIYLKSVEKTETIEITDPYVGLFINLLSKLNDNLNEIFDFDETDDHEKDAFRKIGRYICTEAFYLINTISFLSQKFINKFHEQNGLRKLFDCLNNENLVNNYIKFFENDDTENLEHCDNLLRRNVGTLVCLAKNSGNYKNEWKQCNAVKSLLAYLNKTKHIYDNRTYTCMAIALVSDDDEIDSMPEILECLPEIIDMIRDCSTLISNQDEDIERTQIEIDDEDSDNVVISESCYVTIGITDWALIKLLDAMYHLTVNDNIKLKIYNEFKVKEYLRTIIYYGNATEKEYALKALWQLCFNIEIARDVMDDSEFYSFVKNLAEDTDNVKVSKNAAGIIWLLDKKLNPNAISTPTAEKGNEFFKSTVEKLILPSKLTQHVMISYNRGTRDLCLQIKSELEKLKFKVWIDVENISGSSLESMANAIENSFCILICMTEKYKQSPNCRAEGEYSFQLNRPIIPLIMQKNYTPDGWLGIILGDKIYINFTQNSFETSMEKLNKQLDNLLEQDDEKKLKTLAEPSNSSSTKIPRELSHQRAQIFSQELHSKFKLNSSILNWSEKEVEVWLQEKNVHPIIVENLNSFNGKVLSELFLMKEETPNFFYEAISMGDSNKDLLLKDLAMFSHELKRLFIT